MALLDVIGCVFRSPTSLLLFTAALVSLFVIVHTFFIRRLPTDAPNAASDNYPVTGPWGFWTERWEWYRRRRDQSTTGNFSFHAGPNTIVALAGEESRKLFFESRELGFAEGYAILFGVAPATEKYDSEQRAEEDISNHFSRRLAALLKNDQFRRKLSTLTSDMQEAINAIKNDPSGRTNPFESIYRAVFQLTMRVVGAHEIADNPKLLEETLNLFEYIEASTTATSIILPKFPSPAVLKRTYAGARLYMIIENIVKRRAASDEKHDDALQYLLDQGDRTHKIVEFIVGALFAGLLNSGINAAWVLCYLATSAEWLTKARDEVCAVAAKYARNPTAPLRYQLDDVPLEAWETDFPIVDLCLKDSIRINLLGTAFRKNISGQPLPTGKGMEVIPPNAVVTYATADVHQDPSIYPNPEVWDPARYLPGREEDKKVPHAWLGWGVGRHPCAGMRFAKLEQNIITAYFLASFDFSLENESGKTLSVPPKVDQNGHSASKPKNPPYLRVSSREK
ncbi:Sterol 14-alpha-demethylase [Ascochyta rabiei]|uniref:Heme binding n=1 Tax=Didymella rabiei TaxID=5454 RepID=A0A162WHQ5_DIDRA|nr:Sterol 14-alpha-demethylase [Ascochyta rabiei]KZM19034.1 heme binding [Ascochyta rabiei]UPX10516.1 Sterol 14-alpha-demethylase [Ascochyta rabiei]